MSLKKVGILAGLICMLSAQAASAKIDYTNRFGLRLAVSALPYASIAVDASKVRVSTSPITRAAIESGPLNINPQIDTSEALIVSAGVAMPLQLALTYGITNALEINANFSYNPTLGYLINNSRAFAMPYAIGIGLRYYVNMDEVVRGYLAETLHIGLQPGSIEPETTLGLQWDVSDMVGLFAETGIRPVIVPFSGPFVYTLAASVGLGAQVRF